MIFDGFTCEEVSPKPVGKGCLYIWERTELVSDMSETCPICGILKGEVVKGKLCKDCEANEDLMNQWEWYKMVMNMKSQGKMFIIAYWLLIFLGSAFARLGFFTSLFLVGVWCFNVWFYRYNNYDKRISDEKEKMFLMKLRGVNE